VLVHPDRTTALTSGVLVDQDVLGRKMHLVQGSLSSLPPLRFSIAGRRGDDQEQDHGDVTPRRDESVKLALRKHETTQ
jgi:hypothetical protein